MAGWLNDTAQFILAGANPGAENSKKRQALIATAAWGLANPMANAFRRL